jgi:hypothetical protein
VAGVGIYSVATGPVALTAATTQSMWLLDPVTKGICLTEIGVSFDASATSTAIRVETYVVTSLGSPAGTAGTIVKWIDQNLAAATTTALTALSAEPTTVTALQQWYVQPYGGTLVVQQPLGREPGAAAAATTNRLGLRCITPSGVSPNCVAYVVFQEG